MKYIHIYFVYPVHRFMREELETYASLDERREKVRLRYLRERSRELEEELKRIDKEEEAIYRKIYMVCRNKIEELRKLADEFRKTLSETYREKKKISSEDVKNVIEKFKPPLKEYEIHCIISEEEKPEENGVIASLIGFNIFRVRGELARLVREGSPISCYVKVAIPYFDEIFDPPVEEIPLHVFAVFAPVTVVVMLFVLNLFKGWKQ